MTTIGTFVTSGAVMLKAGINAPIVSEAEMNMVIQQAESTVAVTSRYDWSGAWANLNKGVRDILTDTGSNLAAMPLICKDMSGFTSRYEAETMLDVLRDGAARGIQLLRDTKQQDFINGA